MGVAPACARVAAGTYSRKYRRVNVQRAAETSASSDRRAAISNTPRSPRVSSQQPRAEALRHRRLPRTLRLCRQPRALRTPSLRTYLLLDQ